MNLTHLERIASAGLIQRAEQITALQNSLRADWAEVLSSIATRLGITPEELTSGYQLDVDNGALIPIEGDSLG
jgi:hypothetical protein